MKGVVGRGAQNVPGFNGGVHKRCFAFLASERVVDTENWHREIELCVGVWL